MTLGDKPDLSLDKKRRAKEYFIELFDKGYTDKNAHELVSKWLGKKAADYAYESVLGNSESWQSDPYYGQYQGGD